MACSCGDFANVANRQFTAKRAAKELDAYRRGRIGPTTRLLRDAVVNSHRHARSLIDIGAGVGVLTFELLDRGLQRAIAVDATQTYVAAARQEADRRQRTSAVTFIEGDFVTVAPSIGPAEIVTLDRVVCCYEDYRALLTTATTHASRGIALSFPRDRWFVRWGVHLENALRRLRGNPFRNFVHPPRDIHRLITDAGFRKLDARQTAQWAIEVYGRNS